MGLLQQQALKQCFKVQQQELSGSTSFPEVAVELSAPITEVLGRECVDVRGVEAP